MSESTPKDVPGTRWRVLAHRGSEGVELENIGVLDDVVADDWRHLEQCYPGKCEAPTRSWAWVRARNDHSMFGSWRERSVVDLG